MCVADFGLAKQKHADSSRMNSVVGTILCSWYVLCRWLDCCNALHSATQGVSTRVRLKYRSVFVYTGCPPDVSVHVRLCP